jgi:hypothetical protein
MDAPKMTPNPTIKAENVGIDPATRIPVPANATPSAATCMGKVFEQIYKW